MADDRIQRGILGDIRPREEVKDVIPRRKDRDIEQANEPANEQDESMAGGSRHDRAEHSGSRDVTEGVSGGLGTETGGSRNYRSGSGVTGGDIGNRPE